MTFTSVSSGISYPANIVALKSAIVSAVGIAERVTYQQGELYSFCILDHAGRVVYESPKVVLTRLPEELVFNVGPRSSGYRVILSLFDLRPHAANVQVGRVRYPFRLQKKRRRFRGIVTTTFNVVVLIKGSPHFQAFKLKAERRARAIKFVRERRRPPLKSKKANPVTVTSKVVEQTYDNGSLRVGSTHDRSYVSYSRSYTSTTTPNFFLKKRQRPLPVNPYTMSRTVYSESSLWTETWRSDVPNQAQLTITPVFDFVGVPQPLAVKPQVDFKAIRKLVEHIGPRANVAQDLAQIGQTNRMIANAATRIAKSVSSLKKGNLPGAIGSLWHSAPRFKQEFLPHHRRSLADNWLALQYGWKPLLQDIQESMDSLARFNIASREVFTARSSVTQDETVVTTLRLNQAGSLRCGGQLQVDQQTVRYGIKYKIDDHLSSFLSQTGFTSPVNLAWEILPYSFVVDWFLPIGPYLEMQSAYEGLVFLAGWKTVVQRSSIITNVDFGGNSTNIPNDTHMLAMNGNSKWETISYSRSRLTAFPSPKLPSFKNPISATHAANALALLNTAFHRR